MKCLKTHSENSIRSDIDRGFRGLSTGGRLPRVGRESLVANSN